MTRILRHTLTAALLAALACGCSSDDVTGGAVPSGETQVSFILKMGDAAEGSRAGGTWGDDDYTKEPGVDYDKRVNPDDLKVALYNADGLVANVNILAYYKLDSSSGETTADEGEYRFIGTVKAVGGKELTAGNYKIMVFANCGTQAEDTSIGDWAYDYKEADVKNETQLIPMWGVATAPLQLKKGERDDVGTIELLRAFAKVEINLNSAISDYTITSATLSCHNTKGYCLPADYDKVENTKELDQEDGTGNSNPSSFHPYSGANSSGEPLPFYSGDKKSAYLYIPEYDNSTTPATISLELQDADGKTTTGTLEFKDYANGTATGNAHPIVRNHIYRYTVNVSQGKLTIQAKVMPWDVVTSSIGWMPQNASTSANPFKNSDFYNENIYVLFPRKAFSTSRNTVQKVFNDLYEGLIRDDGETPDEEPNYCVIYRPRYATDNHQTLNENSGGATFFFLLTGPKGATWEAHLTNNDDFQFATTAPSDGTNYFANCTDKSETSSGLTYEEEGPVSRVTHGIARKKPYVIEISCKNSYTAPGSDGGDTYFDDEYLTDWGKKHWNGQRVVDTEFYITVRLADGTEYELDINPAYTADKTATTNFKDKRRYAGTDKRIWFRQLRAKKGWGYDDLAKDVSPSDTKNFEWWRVNPYWKEK